MEGWASDLRFALRQLVRNRGTSLVAVLALALGIGATTAIYAVVYDVLLRPLPYPDSERLVAVFQVAPSGRRMSQMSEPNFEDLAAANRSLAAMAVYSPRVLSVTGGSEPVRAVVASVSASFFDALGVRPALGHVFPEAESGTPEPAVVVSHAFWRRSLGSETDLARLSLRVSGRVHDVIGVLPAAAQFPLDADLYVPKSLEPRNPHRSAHNWRAIGRLRDGVALETAQADLGAIARRLREQHGDHTRMADAAVVPLREALTGRARGALMVLLGSVGFLLLTACANVANLLLAQSAARRRELATRVALGAGRARLARQLVTEASVLCVLGADLGLVLAVALTRGVASMESVRLPRAHEVGVSLEALACAVGLTAATALLLGLLTALRATGKAASASLADGQRAPSTAGSRRLLDALVASQVAASMALLVGGGLLGRSLQRLLDVDPGYRTQSVVAVEVALPSEMPPPARVRFQDEFTGRLRALPGVREAGLVNNDIPLGAEGADGTFLVQDHDVQDPKEYETLYKDPERTGQAVFRVASEGYFQALGIPLESGRLFEPRDEEGAPHVAVVSEAFARQRFFAKTGALGRRVQFGNMDGDMRAFTIVGIVGDVREAGLDVPPRPTLYASHRQRPRTSARSSFVVHADGDTSALVAAARHTLRELDPELPPRFRTVAEVRSASVADRRLTLTLVAAFGASALALAALGIYGVASYAVARRTREVGIRMAIGAQPGQVLRMVLGESGRPVILGAVTGLVMALVLGRLLAAMLFEVRPADTATIVLVAALLGGTALLAALPPARRATRVDPALALRSE
jgi:predicted permease